MRKEPFEIPSILESLRSGVLSGNMTIHDAALELCQAGWSNDVDEDKTCRLLRLDGEK